MKAHLSTFALPVFIATVPQVASAKGCLKRAEIGGVGVHVVGGHGVLGAAAGCAVGRYSANKKTKTQTNQQSVWTSTQAAAPAR